MHPVFRRFGLLRHLKIKFVLKLSELAKIDSSVNELFFRLCSLFHVTQVYMLLIVNCNLLLNILFL